MFICGYCGLLYYSIESVSNGIDELVHWKHNMSNILHFLNPDGTGSSQLKENCLIYFHASSPFAIKLDCVYKRLPNH